MRSKKMREVPRCERGRVIWFDLLRCFDCVWEKGRDADVGVHHRGGFEVERNGELE